MAHMTPSQEAKQLIGIFYDQIGFYPQAKRCALEAVNLIVASLQKNIGYTQCMIDLKHYEFVKKEIESQL